MQTEPAWKAHARRLRATRSVREVADFLTRYYGRKFSKDSVFRACRDGSRQPATKKGTTSDNVENSRDARMREADKAEGWLAQNDPQYSQSRRKWQSRRTDALCRADRVNELTTDESREGVDHEHD
jgi:hypothetical protein